MSNTSEKNEKYIYAVGRRKTAIARVRVYNKEKGDGSITINNKTCKDYFANNDSLIEKVYSPSKLIKLEGQPNVSVRVVGGGPNGQAEAIRLGISRAMLIMDGKHRQELKAQGYLKRDPREVERKKPGLKKARRAPQWQKR